MDLKDAITYHQYHEQQGKRVEEILAMQDRTKKWRAAVSYYFSIHPEARKIYQQTANECMRRRKEIGSVHISSLAKRSDFDQHMHTRVDLPSFVHYAICAFDPEFAIVMTGGETTFAQAKWAKMLKKAFPEFIITEVR